MKLIRSASFLHCSRTARMRASFHPPPRRSAGSGRRWPKRFSAGRHLRAEAPALRAPYSAPDRHSPPAHTPDIGDAGIQILPRVLTARQRKPGLAGIDYRARRRTVKLDVRMDIEQSGQDDGSPQVHNILRRLATRLSHVIRPSSTHISVSGHKASLFHVDDPPVCKAFLFHFVHPFLLRPQPEASPFPSAQQMKKCRCSGLPAASPVLVTRRNPSLRNAQLFGQLFDHGKNMRRSAPSSSPSSRTEPTCFWG